MSVRTGVVTWVAAAAFAGTGAPGALAAPPPERPFDDTSAIAQYIEAVPTAAGPVAARPAPSAPRGTTPPGGGTSGARPNDVPYSLPPAVRLELERGGDEVAKGLEQVATSAAYGAPQAHFAEQVPATDEEEVSAVGGALDAASEERRIPLLVLALGLAAVGAGAYALYRAMRRGGQSDAPFT